MAMQKPKITLIGNPLLRRESVEVTKIDAHIKQIVEGMWNVLNVTNGVGLAAPQIGVNKNIIVFRGKDKNYCLINPMIVEKSEETTEDKEMCLSIPKFAANIARNEKIKVVAKNMGWNDLELEFEGMEARIIQHEIDHLDGRLILDHADMQERVNYILGKNLPRTNIEWKLIIETVKQ